MRCQAEFNLRHREEMHAGDVERLTTNTECATCHKCDRWHTHVVRWGQVSQAERKPPHLGGGVGDMQRRDGLARRQQVRH